MTTTFFYLSDRWLDGAAAAAEEEQRRRQQNQFDIQFRLSVERTSGRMHFYKNL